MHSIKSVLYLWVKIVNNDKGDLNKQSYNMNESAEIRVGTVENSAELSR